jgi:hypothetical protein
MCCGWCYAGTNTSGRSVAILCNNGIAGDGYWISVLWSQQSGYSSSNGAAHKVGDSTSVGYNAAGQSAASRLCEYMTG